MDNELQLLVDDFVYIDGDMQINDLEIKVIKTSHDVSDSNGYVFISEGKSLMYMTDTGYINVRNHGKLKDHDMYVLESNHDIQMLMNGSYPHYLKQRILGSKGHLSNKDCAYYLTEFTTDRTKKVILAHLSEENNCPEKALEAYYLAYEKAHKKAPQVEVAKQKERTEVVNL